ncbi:histone-lysine N-methyltransferase SETMAR [Trichonephila clavipes]|nr:histone-lysine N-methyltransferase SETMAR [Trichonephila clavipes]
MYTRASFQQSAETKDRLDVREINGVVTSKPFSKSAHMLFSRHERKIAGLLWKAQNPILTSWSTRASILTSFIREFSTNEVKKKGENASQGTEIANGVDGADSVTANYVQFWFREFRSGIFDFKDAPCTGRPIIENVDKITEIIEVDRHKVHVWVPHQLTPKSMMDRISICKALAKWNEIDPFIKRMVTGDEKLITCDNIG